MAERLPTKRTIFPIVGESFDNADGSSRQDELFRCMPGEPVTLMREPENPHDRNAILVVSCRGIGIGHIDRATAVLLAPHLDRGREYRAHIHELRGGMVDYESYGAIICIVWDGRVLPPARALQEVQVDYRAMMQAAGPGSRGSGMGCAGALILLLGLSGIMPLFRR